MSAYDLAIVARNVLAVPEIANPAKTLDYDFTDPTGTAAPPHEPQRRASSPSYPGATGLKTGFTEAREPHARHRPRRATAAR